VTRLWLRWTWHHLRLLARDRDVMFWNVGFFVLLLVLFLGVLSGGDQAVRISLTISLVTIGIMATALFSVGVGMAGAHERGVFARFALVPLGRGVIVAAVLSARVVLVLATAALQLCVAAVVFRVPWSGGMASWIAVITAGALAFSAIGFLISTAAASSAGANTYANLVFIPMMALSGTAVPLSLMPPAWASRSWILPSATIASALNDALVAGASVADNARALAYLAGWAAVAAALGVYRWTRRHD